MASSSTMTDHRVLNLSKGALTLKKFDELVKCLCTDTTLIELNLSSNPWLRCGGAERLSRALERNETLEILNLMNDRVVNVDAIGRLFVLNSAIQEVYLSGNPMGSAGAMALAMALSTNTTIRVLHLDGCYIGSYGVHALADLIAANHPSLRELRIRANKGGTVEEARRLALALKKNHTLTSLYVGFTEDAMMKSMELLRDSLVHNITLHYLVVMRNASDFYYREHETELFLRENRLFTKMIQSSTYTYNHGGVSNGVLSFFLSKISRYEMVYQVLRSRAHVLAERRFSKSSQAVLKRRSIELTLVRGQTQRKRPRGSLRSDLVNRRIK